MLLQHGLKTGVLLVVVQAGLAACTNGGVAVGGSSSSAADGGASSSVVSSSISSQSSSKASKQSSSISSASSSSSVSSASSSKASSSSAMSSSSRSSISSSSSSRSSTSSSSSMSSVSSSVSGNLSIRVDGKDFKDASGNVIQLRGVNLMGMEYTAIQGSRGDPYPQVVESTWAALHGWKVNIVRIPLNEDSYLGLSCVNSSNAVQNADPGNNYKTRLKQVVDRATAEGFYVILDLHLTAPNDSQNTVNNVTAQCATAQNPVADADHSIAFWTDIATNYKSYYNVMFELFNEPYINQWYHFSGNKAAAWQALRDGVQMDSYVPLWSTSYGHTWQSAGMQAMLDAVRGTGATNVILESGLDYSATLDSWPTYKANDPLNQLAAVWHAYPAYGYAWGTECYTHPGWCDDRSYTNADAILAANYPVIVTEFGDQCAPGTSGAPFASTLLPKLDARGISYLGWTFTATACSAGNPGNVLIKDNNGTPTDGYGVYVKAHYLCRDAGTANCP